jgi:thiamine biosynthesis protein ThiI
MEQNPINIVVHYDEIGLKGRNRPRFERRLMRNIKQALHEFGRVDTVRLYGRILVKLEEGCPWSLVAERMARVFGISYFARGYVTPCDLAAVKENMKEQLPRTGYNSFMVETEP